jgi:hypothetical protein
VYPTVDHAATQEMNDTQGLCMAFL